MQCRASGDIDADGELTVLDIDFAIKRFGELRHGETPTENLECPPEGKIDD
jgi:hypothetical protein